MTRRLLAALALIAAAAAPHAQTDRVHTFEVIDGAVYLDGGHLPDAVPAGLDLTGLHAGPLEFSGPITPVLEVDGRAYVLEGTKLVPLAESSQGGRGVYVMGSATTWAIPPDQMPEEQVTPIVEEAYMRDVASRNQALYERMSRERAMEQDVMALAARVRALEPGGPRRALRDRLRGLLSDLLTLKHEIRAEEIAVAAQRLDAARASLAGREGQHDEIVDGRLRELVGDQ